jgi:hypothetical protein
MCSVNSPITRFPNTYHPGSGNLRQAATRALVADQLYSLRVIGMLARQVCRLRSALPGRRSGLAVSQCGKPT